MTHKQTVAPGVSKSASVRRAGGAAVAAPAAMPLAAGATPGAVPRTAQAVKVKLDSGALLAASTDHRLAAEQQEL